MAFRQQNSNWSDLCSRPAKFALFFDVVKNNLRATPLNVHLLTYDSISSGSKFYCVWLVHQSIGNHLESECGSIWTRKRSRRKAVWVREWNCEEVRIQKIPPIRPRPLQIHLICSLHVWRDEKCPGRIGAASLRVRTRYSCYISNSSWREICGPVETKLRFKTVKDSIKLMLAWESVCRFDDSLSPWRTQ